MAAKSNNYKCFEANLKNSRKGMPRSLESSRSSLTNSMSTGLKMSTLDKYSNLENPRGFGHKVGTFSSFEDDSGYGSSGDFKKSSRWIGMSQQLLHKDVKLFLKKNLKVVKASHEVPKRKSFRNDFNKQSVFDSCYLDNDEEFISKLHKRIVIFHMENNTIIAANLLMLCDSLSEFFKQLEFVERKIFNISGSLRTKVDMKSIILLGSPSDLFCQKFPQLFKVLAYELNLNSVDKMICQMQNNCATQGIPTENFESEFAELKDNTDKFFMYLNDYKKFVSVENFDNLVQIIQRLGVSVSSITTHLWIISSLSTVQ